MASETSSTRYGLALIIGVIRGCEEGSTDGRFMGNYGAGEAGEMFGSDEMLKIPGESSDTLKSGLWGLNLK